MLVTAFCLLFFAGGPKVFAICIYKPTGKWYDKCSAGQTETQALAKRQTLLGV